MAIKVSGTNVITDSRALNNITSIDTTTKNAIGAAGVGGQTTLITNRTSFSSSTLQISLPDYTSVRVLLFKVRDNDTSGGKTQFRLTNSSGSLITGSEYNYANLSSGYYSQSLFSFQGDDPLSSESANYNTTVDMMINNGYDSDALTSVNGYRTVNRGGSSNIERLTGMISTKQRNQHITFFNQSGGSFSGYYSVWGIS